MNDIALKINEEQGIDIEESGDLDGDGTIKTAILLSLFTDRRAGPSEIPAFQTDPRGYWGDHIAGSTFRTGSKLWLHRRAKNAPFEVAQIVATCREALDWLLEDGLVHRVEVLPEVRRDNLRLKVCFDQSSIEVQLGGANGL